MPSSTSLLSIKLISLQRNHKLKSFRLLIRKNHHAILFVFSRLFGLVKNSYKSDFGLLRGNAEVVDFSSGLLS